MYCIGCKYFQKSGDYGGQCYRYPPQLYFVSSNNNAGSVNNDRPLVRDTDFCGEFEEKKDG